MGDQFHPGRHQCCNDGTNGWSEYTVDFAESGKYDIYTYMASGDPRPLRLQLDGVRHRKKLANHVTGGFGTDEMTWSQEEAQLFVGDVGVHTIRLETKGFFPHVSGLLFSPVDPNAPAPEPEKE